MSAARVLTIGEARAFVKEVRDHMFFKCTGEPPHRADGPIPGNLLCEGCVIARLRACADCKCSPSPVRFTRDGNTVICPCGCHPAEGSP